MARILLLSKIENAAIILFTVEMGSLRLRWHHHRS